MAESTGPGWIPESRVSTPESTSQGAVIALLFQIAWWLPAGVASQKSGPVAGDMPRFARQHTNIARKEPETPSGWTPAGLRKPARVSTLDQPRFARAHDPEHIAMDSFRKAISLAVWCLAGNCLIHLNPIDSLIIKLRPGLLNVRQGQLNISLKRGCIEESMFATGNVRS